MAGKEANLLEAFLVDELCHAFPRRQLSRVVLLLDAFSAAAEFELGTLGAQFGDLVRHGRCLRAFCLTYHSCSPVGRFLLSSF